MPRLDLLRVIAVGWLSACSASAPRSDHEFRELRIDGEVRIDQAANPSGDLVQLRAQRFRAAPWIAVHQWFLAYDAGLDRWESWELRRSRRGRSRSRSDPVQAHYSDGRPPRELIAERVQEGCVRGRLGIVEAGRTTGHTVQAEWRGEEARRLMQVLRRPRDYPGWDAYRMWPGRNSNTYIAWVVREAEVAVDLHPMSVGKDYLGAWGFGVARTTGRTGLQINTPLLGTAIGLREGVELHLLQLTWGLDLWPPALKTPFGRLGFPE